MSETLDNLDRKLAALPDCRTIAAELSQQPEFFSLYRDELPGTSRDKPVLALSRYNGIRSGDEQVNLRVGAMRLLGLSDRAIERECGVDRRTIPHRLQWLEHRKLIPALKDRVAMRTGDLAERSALVLSVLLDRSLDECSLELASMIKAVATTHGITVEKMQLLTGQATEIVQHLGADGRGEIEAWARQVGAAIEVTTEVQPGSDVSGTCPGGQTWPISAGLGASPTDPKSGAMLDGPADREAGDQGNGPAQGGGGGVAGGGESEHQTG